MTIIHELVVSKLQKEPMFKLFRHQGLICCIK